jgi:GTPase SAR1 family protein
VQVVFLGNGRSGKTSMLRTLAKKPLQPDQLSTRGVTVDAFADDLKPGFADKRRHGFDLELSFWDFAGQLEYSAAHEFFMSMRQAVYVVVYSVLEDDESVMQQLLHWFSVIPEPAACPHVRLMIVGTKIDLVLANELQGVMQCKRSVVRQVVEARGLVHKILDPDVLFVSSLHSFSFESPGLNLTWAACRRALKDRIYSNCTNIFDCQDPQQRQLLKFPKECKDMKLLVEQLKKVLKKKQNLLCCRLDHEDAVEVLSQILETKDKSLQKLYYTVDLVGMSLEILNDLGIIVLYGGAGSLRAPERASAVRSICLEPQFLPGIMSLLVDPQTLLPAVTTVGALMHLMENNHAISRICKTSPDNLKHQFLELLESVGIVRRYGGSERILVPLALRGRPVSWSQIIRTAKKSAVLLGWRLGTSASFSVPAASFMKLMLDKCADAELMWGCAFVFEVGAPGGGRGGSFVFVRLREDRRSVDIVAVMDEDQGSHDVAQREVDSIARMLGKDFNRASARMHLCPMCCSADMFVRSGAVHAFHLQEVAAGGALHCSRYHDVTSSDVIRGKLTKLDTGSLPLVYPSRLQKLQLPWKRVASGGIISSDLDAQGSPPSSDFETARYALDHMTLQFAPLPPQQNVSFAHASGAADASYLDGTFTDVSFFVLTGQVAAGDVVAADHLFEFNRQLGMCSSQDCICEVALSSGQRKTLHFSYTLGQYIPNAFFDTPIARIFPADIGDRAQDPHAPTVTRFCAHDNVLVLFGPLQPRTKFLVFPGSSVNLQLCRLTPALCQSDLTAACCWSELQVRCCCCVFTVQVARAYALNFSGPNRCGDGS